MKVPSLKNILVLSLCLITAQLFAFNKTQAALTDNDQIVTAAMNVIKRTGNSSGRGT